MLRLAAFYLFAVFLAVQSFAAAADTHGVHQGSDQHVNLDTEHGFDDDSQEDHHSNMDQDDCQHCCHCHGSNLFLAPNSNHLNIPGLLEKQNLGRNHYLSQLIDPDSRPPIV